MSFDILWLTENPKIFVNSFAKMEHLDPDSNPYEHFIKYIKKPLVILRIFALMFSIIVFGCVTSQGWRWDKHTVSEVCIIHDSYSTCRLGSTVAILAFILSIGNRLHFGNIFWCPLCCPSISLKIWRHCLLQQVWLDPRFTSSGILVCEFYFEQLPTTANRKQVVVADLVFSGLFSILFLVSFSSLAHQWSLSKEPRGHYGRSNIGAAIAFSFFSIFIWVNWKGKMLTVFTQKFRVFTAPLPFADSRSGSSLMSRSLCSLVQAPQSAPGTRRLGLEE